MCRDREPVHPAFGHAPELTRDLSDAKAVWALRSWLQRCEQSHESCRAPISKLPTRVLDLSAQKLRLVEFRDGASPHRKYASMSHCWGDPRNGKPTRTKRQTLESRKAGIEPYELSPLFRDAIHLCRMVGCDYLWIDSLCIVQDDPLDWEVESKKMAEIYSNAEFNIAATSCRDGTRGMFKQRWSVGRGDGSDQPMLTYEIIFSSATDGVVSVREAHNFDHRFVQGGLCLGRMEKAPLLNRAWVLQEMLLSRRTLHVCSSELIWECRTLCDCECWSLDSDGRHHLDYKQQLTRIRELCRPAEEIYDLWLEICQRYSGLAITHVSDRTVALAGLVQAFQPATNGSYFAGVWKEDLARALIWRGLPPSSPKISRAGNSLPTWSWMSRALDDGQCQCYFPSIVLGYRQEPSMSVTTAKGCLTAGKDEWPVITFEGPTIRAIIYEAKRDGHREYYVATIPLCKSMADSKRILLAADCPMSSNELLRGGDRVECLLFGTDEGAEIQYILVVKKCRGREEGVYRRVGILDTLQTEVSPARGMFRNARSERIRIV